jgi:hypothetical protein
MLKTLIISATLGTALITLCTAVTAIAVPAKWYLIYSDKNNTIDDTYVDLNSIKREASSSTASGIFSFLQSMDTVRYNCSTWASFNNDGTIRSFWTDFPPISSAPVYSSGSLLQVNRAIFKYLCPNSQNPWNFLGTQRNGRKFYLHKNYIKLSSDIFQIIVAQYDDIDINDPDIFGWQLNCRSRQIREKKISPLYNSHDWNDWHNELPNSMGESMLNYTCKAFYASSGRKIIFPNLQKLP